MLIKTQPPPVFSDGKDTTDRDYENMDSDRWKLLAKRFFNVILEAAHGRADRIFPITLLDVGCGAGYFSNEAKLRGFDVTGIDISKTATDYAHKKFKVKTICTDLLKFKTKEKFDVILLNHVLEHISDLPLFLNKIKKLLNKKGIVLIASPNYHSLMRFLFGNRWYGLRPDQHVWQFTPESLSFYLKSQGFKIIKIIPSSLDYNPPNRIKNLIFGIMTWTAEKLDLGDQLIILCGN